MKTVNSKKTMTAVVTAVLLSSVPIKGMDEVINLSNTHRIVHERVNEELQNIRCILETKLRTDNHVVKNIDNVDPIVQCKLSAMKSPLISGKGNKPLRNDLRSLLYKPQTDPYYGENLSQKDFTLLTILKDAIDDSVKEQPFLDDQNNARSALDNLLSVAPIDHRRDNPEQHHGGYRDLFLRRRLDEINTLFARGKFVSNDGIADLSMIPGLAGRKQDPIRMTLSKAYMMHMLNNDDQKNIEFFKKYIVKWRGFESTFDTYAQRRLFEILDELEGELQKNIPISERILHVMNGVDLKWLHNPDQNREQTLEKSWPENIDALEKNLGELLGGREYLSYFPLYRDRPLLQNQHKVILRTVHEKDTVENLTDFFTELSQLKVSLNSLGNGRERSVMGLTQWIDDSLASGPVKWLQLQRRVVTMKKEIENLQFKILAFLEGKNKVSVDAIIHELERRQEEKRHQIKKDQQKKDIWILSLDGGGVRGKIAAEILLDLSRRLKKRGKNQGLSDTFDLVIGTSVGGLISLALTIPDETGKPAMDERDIATLVEPEKASIIFPFVHPVAKILGQLSSSAYEATPMENLLLANFGYTPLSAMRKETMVMAHNNRTQEPTKLGSHNPSTEEITVAGAAATTAAAPTYLPPSTQLFNGRLEEFVDGGLTANNPVYHGLSELLNMREAYGNYPLTRINILSIGTGKATYDHPHGTHGTGIAGVMNNFNEGTMEQTMRDAHNATVSSLTHLINQGVDVSYYRLDPDLEEAIELDSATEENIAKLRTLVHRSILQSSFYGLLVRHLSGDEDITRNKYVEIRKKGLDHEESFLGKYPYLASMRKG